MAQHFLLSAQARTLSLRSIFAGGEEAAYTTFRKLRWPATGGDPVCPRCGSLRHYGIPTRRRFKCADCQHQFSVTSGTIFASRKLSFTDLLAAVCILANAAKGVSALQLSRDLDVQAKTAFVLAHKVREAMASETTGAELSGEVEVDGAYFGGHIRPANLKAERKDRRLPKYQTGKRRVVIVARQRGGRTLTFVAPTEAPGADIIPRMVAKGSRIVADEASHWDKLHALYEAHRINHQVAYSLNGVNTNMAESFFSRLRRMVEGQHHHVSARYLHAYAAHAAWLEDHRRQDNGGICYRAVGLAMAHSVSRQWAGYWQRGR